MATWYGEPAYGLTRHLAGADKAEAIGRVKLALQQEGFGVLTEIDVQATFDSKLGRAFRPYVILGACNPHLAWRALEVEPGVGLLLPCNVVIAEDADGAIVSIADPRALANGVGGAGIVRIATEAHERLERALQNV